VWQFLDQQASFGSVLLQETSGQVKLRLSSDWKAQVVVVGLWIADDIA
jgi:hypothetical protein